MQIRVRNLLENESVKTYLATSVAAGTTSLTVKNSSGFTSQYAIQIGQTGEEQTEVVIGTVNAGTLLTTPAISFEHPADTPVILIKYDQVVFERSASGTAGSATPMTNGTVTYQADNTYTQFDDTTGGTAHAYRTRFRNSASGLTTLQSDWITSSGFTFYSLAKLRERAKNRLYNSTYLKNDEVINDWINEYLQMMQNVAVDVNKDYALGTTTVGFSGTAQLGTITATDFKEVRRVWFTTNGTDYYKATKLDITGFTPQETFSATMPKYYFQGDNVLGRQPYDTSGTAQIVYYQVPTVLVNDTDELPVSMHSYTKGFIDYAQAQALYMDNKPAMADRYNASAVALIEKFKEQITPRSMGGPQQIQIVDVVSSEDEIEYL